MTIRTPRRRAALRRTTLRPRIAILPYGISDSATALKVGLEAAGPFVTKLRVLGSTFRGHGSDFVINWGNSTIGDGAFLNISGTARVYNRPEAIRNASNKIESFRLMTAAGVPTVEHTTNLQTALSWFNEGSLVYARTRLQGHSGAGIVMSHREPETIDGVGNGFEVRGSMVNAPLYTKGITAQRREFRIHVMGGVVINVQQKKRADGWRDNPTYSNTVRNHGTGWIYATSDISPNTSAIDAAINAVRALGLDFGAVDVITRRDEAWVLEVNTAPGLEGSNLNTYVNNLYNVFTGLALDPWIASTPLPEETSIDPTPPRRAEVITASDQEPARQARVESTGHGDSPARNQVSIRNGSFYRATVRGEPTIVQYNQDLDGFYMPGWEIPMSQGEEGFVVNLSEEVNASSSS